MTPRQSRILLILLSAACALGGVAVLMAGVTMPIDLSQKEAFTPDTTDDISLANESSVPSIESFAKFWKHDFRRPLYDPPPPPPKVVTPPPPQPLPVKLIGTIREEGRSLAILEPVRGRGATHLLGVGEKLQVPGGEIEILQVGAETVRLRYLDDDRTLKIEGESP